MAVVLLDACAYNVHCNLTDFYGYSVISKKCFTAHLEELEQLLKGIAMMKELTLRTKDYLVSFGECMSTRLFAAYLNKIGVKARQVCSSSITCVCFNVIAILCSPVANI